MAKKKKSEETKEVMATNATTNSYDYSKKLMALTDEERKSTKC